MANYKRTFSSNIWGESRFNNYSVEEKLFYIFLLTSEETSDTSVFQFIPELWAVRLGIPLEKLKKLIKKFERLEIISIDRKTNEILVQTYFDNHTPSASLSYEYYYGDLSRIKSQSLLKELAEISKKYVICRSFYLALTDVLPNETFNEADYTISKSSVSDDELRTSAARGRKKAAESRKSTIDFGAIDIKYDESGLPKW